MIISYVYLLHEHEKWYFQRSIEIELYITNYNNCLWNINIQVNWFSKLQTYLNEKLQNTVIPT